MDRYGFLHAVLPAEGGNYVAVFAKQDMKWNRHFATIEELADGCVEASNRGLTAYFALGTFQDNISEQPDGKIKTLRKAAMAHQFKTYAIDIDCGEGKPYADASKGMEALIQFIKTTKFPVPLVVSSGNGIHAYWPLTTPISRETWKANSTQLKAICHEYKLEIDDSKVHDPSMVLRPLDTINFKGGNTVRALLEGAACTPEQAEQHFERCAPVKQAAKKPAHLTAAQTINDIILAASVTQYPPFSPDKVTNRCQQMQWATEGGGKNADYGMWWLVCGMAKFAEAPEATVIRWSEKHETFDASATLAKMESWGALPPTCGAFDAARPGVCPKCAFWKNGVGSPSRLGLPEPEPLTPVATFADEVEEGEPVRTGHVNDTAPVVEAPEPFRRTAQGVQVEIAGSWQIICAYDLFPVQIVRDPMVGHDMVEWVWNKPHVGYTRMRIRMAFIFNDSSIVELNNTLADNGFLVPTKVKQAYLGGYMRAYVQLLQKHQAAVELYDSFGWKDNNTKFVIGSTEMRREASGAVTTHEVGVSKLITTKGYDRTFSTKGDLATWVQWTKILDHRDLSIHQNELARAFAAPLYAFTGLRGMVISLLGKTGYGKTTMQDWAASVYGIPKRVNTTVNDTQMSMVQRMGIWNCLPLGIDEVTLIKPELLANLIYWGTQGQDRNRVTETTQANTWALPLSLSTNRSLRDKATTVGADVTAIQMRMLEYSFNQSAVFTEDKDYGRKINTMIADNYGLAGRVYLNYLLQLGEKQIKADIEQRMHYVMRHYGMEFEPNERYWQTHIVLCDLGSYYAKQLGLILYDFHKGTASALEQVRQQRAALNGAQLDSYDLISDYLTSFNHAALVLGYYGNRANMRTSPKGEVRIRIELYYGDSNSKSPDRGFAFLDKTHFHHWLVSKGFDFKTVMDTLLADSAGFRPGRSGRIYMGKDSTLTLPSCTVVGINLGHAKFKGMLDQHTDGNIVDITAAHKKGEAQ